MEDTKELMIKKNDQPIGWSSRGVGDLKSPEGIVVTPGMHKINVHGLEQPRNHREPIQQIVYLAGPITGLTWEDCGDWREYVDTKLPDNIHPASPLRSKGYLKGTGILKDSYSKEQVGHVLSTSKSIFARDTFDVSRCDAILVNFLGAKTVSIGTVIECTLAHKMGKPVIVAIEDEGNIHEHSMLNETYGFRVNNLDQAIAILIAVLNPGV